LLAVALRCCGFFYAIAEISNQVDAIEGLTMLARQGIDFLIRDSSLNAMKRLLHSPFVVVADHHLCGKI
jgi:hypothetical protein